MELDSYTLSHFLRHSGEVLEAVTAGPVVLSRRDGDDVMLDAVTRADAAREAIGLLAETMLDAMSDEAGRNVFAAKLGSAARWTSGLTRDERERLLKDVAGAGAEATGHGSVEPLIRALDRWKRLARMRADERPASAHLTRPVAIPDDVDDPSIEKANGVVELPLRVRWSYPLRAYDLDDPRQLRRVYEQVLREGTDEDVRFFIDVDELVSHWDELVLPPPVRRTWADWLRRRRGLRLSC